MESNKKIHNVASSFIKKMLQRKFKNLISTGFEHDLELVLLAKNDLKYELPVIVHMPGSKLNIFIDPIKMLIGILKSRFLI